MSDELQEAVRAQLTSPGAPFELVTEDVLVGGEAARFTEFDTEATPEGAKRT